MIGVSIQTNVRMTQLIAQLVARKRLALREGFSTHDAERLLADGARGINQERPPIPPSQLKKRYHSMTEAILFGCAASR